MSEYPRTWAEIDLGAIHHNVRVLRERLGGALLAVVVKADAYGHGIVPASRAASAAGADWLAVATVHEGVALREAEIEAPILILSPFLPMEAEQVVFYRLRASVQDLTTARELSRAAAHLGREVVVHLKVDTGMHRFGAPPQEAASLAVAIAKLPHVRLEGIWTHFAWSAGAPEFTAQQFELFQATLAGIQGAGVRVAIRHCSNSGALLKHPEMTMDLARIGILAYGVSHVSGFELPLRRALTWKSRIMAIRRVPKGDSVGYNMTWRADRDSRIATVGIGYGDGYHRMLSNRGWVMIRGMCAPIRGLVCMDQVMVDITEIREAQVGDEVTLIGDGVTAEQLAELVGTTPHEITTRVMSRVPRFYIY
ncbi:MAG: alanine racemase [Armatimonadota bacterium]